MIIKICVFFLFLSPGISFSQQLPLVKYSSSDFKNEIFQENKKYSFELNFVLYFGTFVVCEILESTSPVNELIKYSEKGFYKTEIVYLFLLSREKKIKFKELTKEIMNGKTLAEISRGKNYDFMVNFNRAEEIKNILQDEGQEIKRLHDILVNKRDYPNKYSDE